MMMKKTIVAAILFNLSTWSQANEMNLSPTYEASGVAESAQELPAQSVYRIPFRRYYGKLGNVGKNTVSGILPRLKAADKIVIQGRPDPADGGNYPAEKAREIPQLRAQALKKMLLSNGIDESKISLETLNDVSNSDTANVYNATIKVYSRAQNNEPSRNDAAAVVPLSSASKLDAASAGQILPAGSMRRVLKTAVDNNLSAIDTGRLFESWVAVEAPGTSNKKPFNPNEKIIPLSTARRLLKIAIDNDLSATDARRMFESWIAVEYTTVPEQAVILSSRPHMQMAETGQFKIAMNTADNAPQQVWHLDPGKNLRDNIYGWAHDAGWNQPQWGASTQYQVTRELSYDGEFTDALRQISSQAKLNICVNKATKFVKITDSNVSCKE